MIHNEKIIAVRKYYDDNSDAEHVFKAYTNARETRVEVEYTYKGMRTWAEIMLDDNDGVVDIIHKLNDRLNFHIWSGMFGSLNHHLFDGAELLRKMAVRHHTMIEKEGELKL